MARTFCTKSVAVVIVVVAVVAAVDAAVVDNFVDVVGLNSMCTSISFVFNLDMIIATDLSWNRRGKEGGKGFVFTWNPRKQMDRWT